MIWSRWRSSGFCQCLDRLGSRTCPGCGRSCVDGAAAGSLSLGRLPLPPAPTAASGCQPLAACCSRPRTAAALPAACCRRVPGTMGDAGASSTTGVAASRRQAAAAFQPRQRTVADGGEPRQWRRRAAAAAASGCLPLHEMRRKTISGLELLGFLQLPMSLRIEEGIRVT